MINNKELEWLNKKELLLVFLVTCFLTVLFLLPFVQADTWSGNLSTDILSYYKLDDNNARDWVAGANNGTISGTTNVMGKIQYGQDFEETESDYIGLGSGTISMTDGNFTINSWVKVESLTSPTAHPILAGTDSGDFGFYIKPTTGKLALTKIGVDEVVGTDIVLVGTWTMVTIVYDTSANLMYFYINGTADSGGAKSYSSTFDVGVTYYLGKLATEYQDGIMDEVGVWTRALSANDIVYLYNSGLGCQYGNESCFGIPSPPEPEVNVSLVSPIDFSTVTNSSQIFVCNVSSTNPTSNVTFYLWNSSEDLIYTLTKSLPYYFCYQESTNVSNQTGLDNCGGMEYSGGYFINGSWIYDLDLLYDGDFDTSSGISSGSIGQFFVNYSKPIYSKKAITFLKYYYQSSPFLRTVNYSIPDNCFNQTQIQMMYKLQRNTSNNLLVYCWDGLDYSLIDYILGGFYIFEEAMYWNITNNGYSFTTTLPNIDTYHWTCNASDNNSLTNVSSSNYTITYEPKSYLVNYTSHVYSSQSNTIWFNLSSTIPITSSNATLTYNNTNYTMTLYMGNLTESDYQVTITAPTTFVDINKSLNVTFWYNGKYYITTDNLQLVSPFPSLVVSSSPCSDISLHFQLFDEQTFGSLNGTFKYNFKYGASNTTFYNIYGQLNNVHDLYLCYNSTIYPTVNLGSSEVDYQVDNYNPRRWYGFTSMVLTTTINEISLYNLNSTYPTTVPFQITTQDTSLNHYKDKFLHILRYYPQNDTTYTTDIGLTDNVGQTVIYVQSLDVDYQLILYNKDGSLVGISDKIRPICSTTPCSYLWLVQKILPDYSSIFNIQYTLDYNYTSGVWTFIFSDPSMKTQTMNLTVYRDVGDNSYVICSGLVSGYVGTITCNTSLYKTGIQRAEVYRTASPLTAIVQKIINLMSSPFTSSTGLIFSLILAIPIMFILVLVSPFAAIIGGVIALIPALYLGSITIGVFAGIVIIAGLIAHLIKRVS